MTERVKLKRGLSDISPLFSKKEDDFKPKARVLPPVQMAPVALLSVTTPEICFIWSADDEGDSHFLNNFFASKMVSSDAGALLMTLEERKSKTTAYAKTEPWNRSLHRMHLPVYRVQEAFDGASWTGAREWERRETHIFLEMSMKSLLSQPELVRSLDHVIIFLKPNVDSVTETYRKLKLLAALALQAEVTVLFDADNAGGLPSKLYELFSDFVSRRLSLPMSFLGTLHLSHGAEGLRQDICWESWSAARTVRSENIEKMHFLSWIDRLKKEEVPA